MGVRTETTRTFNVNGQCVKEVVTVSRVDGSEQASEALRRAAWDDMKHWLVKNPAVEPMKNCADALNNQYLYMGLDLGNAASMLDKQGVWERERERMAREIKENLAAKIAASAKESAQKKENLAAKTRQAAEEACGAADRPDTGVTSGRAYQVSVADFMTEVRAEVERARAKFPGANANMVALMEEVGELAKAMLSEPFHRVRQEAMQVACVATRIALEGDPTLDNYRAKRALAASPTSNTRAAD